jgi:cobalt/nickel transport system permease protein
VSAAASGIRAPGLAALDPRARVLLLLAFAIAAVALRRPESVVVALAVAGAGAVLARLPLLRVARRLAAAQLGLAPFLLTLPFAVPGVPIAALGPLTASAEGLERAATLWLRVNAILLAAQVLVGTLDAGRLAAALYRLGAPEALAHLLAFTVRYLGLLEQEYARLRTAMRARAFRARSDRHTWRSLGHLAGMLIVRSAARAERVMEAMRCRGFTGRLPVPEALVWRARDAAWLSLACACLLALVAVDRR